ncbi:MAG: hypothetical protein JW739_04505 [Opitutales bacterium]|nr:hypothetical protein [Opitutales bacterium]
MSKATGMPVSSITKKYNKMVGLCEYVSRHQCSSAGTPLGSNPFKRLSPKKKDDIRNATLKAQKMSEEMGKVDEFTKAHRLDSLKKYLKKNFTQEDVKQAIKEAFEAE